MGAFVDAFRSKRVGLCIPLGFASGLPYSMRGSTLGAWMTRVDINLKTVTLFTVFGLLFTLKPLWAPVVDRYQIPLLGRRRGWMLVTQVGLLLSIAGMGAVDPHNALWMLAMLTGLTTFLTATHDIANDAYRVDLLRPNERASGSATFTMGYRIAVLVSGAGALALSDFIGWSAIYTIMACLMVVGLLATWLGPEPEMVQGPRTLRAAVVEPLIDLFSRRGAVAAIAFVLLYKVGDYMVADIITPFLLKTGFSGTEIAGVQKVMGMVATIFGVIIGAGAVAALGVRRALLVFGILQAATNAGYLALALVGKHHVLLIVAITVDWFCNGLGQAAFSAYMLSLCTKRFSATQYALISSASTLLGRLVGIWNGHIITAIGWPMFFVITLVVAVPGILLIVFASLERAVIPAEPTPAAPAPAAAP
jgi:PAT family beta-lactamase induction signal transducer AmpG